MKVREAKFRAIWWAASGAVPKAPITRVMTLNSMASNSMVRPIGRPSFISSARARPDGRSTLRHGW